MYPQKIEDSRATDAARVESFRDDALKATSQACSKLCLRVIDISYPSSWLSTAGRGARESAQNSDPCRSSILGFFLRSAGAPASASAAGGGSAGAGSISSGPSLSARLTSSETAEAASRQSRADARAA